MRDLKIIVVGAGIGGLTAALSLLRAGFKVEVYEASPELGEIGAGLSLGPNCTRLLTHLGLNEALKPNICYRTRGTVKNGMTDELLLAAYKGGTAEDIFGSPYYFLHRADLHGALADAVAGLKRDCIHTRRVFTHYRETDSGLDVHFEGGSIAKGDALIGSDGIKSAVRSELFGAGDPRFTANIAWRGLVPIDRLMGHMEKEASGLWVGPRRHIVYYPVRNHTLMNYVAATEKSGWEVESWNVHSEVSEVLDEFDDWHEVPKQLIGQTPPELCYKWALFDREPLDAWTKGRVTLLGDAAHPMLPFLGQGASMAIEDGVVLARCFQVAGDIGEAFQRYEATRKERANWVLLESRESGHRMHQDDVDVATFEGNQVMQGAHLFPYDAASVEI